MVKIPFFHYTYLDNLIEIFRDGNLRSRAGLSVQELDYEDISIDPEQNIRKQMGLLEYVPIFPGYFKKYYRQDELDAYLRENYDDPRVYNRSFYGSLNKTLRAKLEEFYEKIVLLLLNHDKIIRYAEEGNVRFFDTIAIKGLADEFVCDCENDLLSNLTDCMGENGHLYCEIDIQDEGSGCLLMPEELEMVIVDNYKIRESLLDELKKFMTKEDVNELNIIVAPLPRDD